VLRSSEDDAFFPVTELCLEELAMCKLVLSRTILFVNNTTVQQLFKETFDISIRESVELFWVGLLERARFQVLRGLGLKISKDLNSKRVAIEAEKRKRATLQSSVQRKGKMQRNKCFYNLLLRTAVATSIAVPGSVNDKSIHWKYNHPYSCYKLKQPNINVLRSTKPAFCGLHFNLSA